MHTKHRVMLCLLSTIIAFAGVALTGAGHPAAKLLHEWYYGVIAIFLAVFTALMVMVLRGNLEKSFWVIPLSAALSYPAATFAYIAYFISFEPQRLLNTLNQIRLMEKALGHGQIFDVAILLLFVGPTISFAWFFGAVAGAVFSLVVYLIQKRAHLG